MFQNSIPRFSEKELFRDIRELFKSKCIEEKFIDVNLVVSNLGKTIDLRVSEDIPFNDELIKMFLKYNSWIAGKNFDKYASVPVTYQIECKKNRVKTHNWSDYYGSCPKERIKKFLFYEGLTGKSG